MQLFGLVNTMLANDRTTAERDLSIARCGFEDPDLDLDFTDLYPDLNPYFFLDLDPYFFCSD